MKRRDLVETNRQLSMRGRGWNEERRRGRGKGMNGWNMKIDNKLMEFLRILHVAMMQEGYEIRRHEETRPRRDESTTVDERKRME
uniref:Uncharacterized protein n=1 Tax=Pristionchus pacificus TaxID=54126 RepID=A0A2A6CWK5_PRIPA|eukprot:PDM82470.1 hypothetical protein PRIPAC_36863 [Pristionchus pacificus]